MTVLWLVLGGFAAFYAGVRCDRYFMARGMVKLAMKNPKAREGLELLRQAAKHE